GVFDRCPRHATHGVQRYNTIDTWKLSFLLTSLSHGTLERSKVDLFLSTDSDSASRCSFKVREGLKEKNQSPIYVFLQNLRRQSGTLERPCESWVKASNKLVSDYRAMNKQKWRREHKNQAEAEVSTRASLHISSGSNNSRGLFLREKCCSETTTQLGCSRKNYIIPPNEILLYNTNDMSRLHYSIVLSLSFGFTRLSAKVNLLLALHYSE
ncbi:hypothetical protein J6590_009875, partial [Homalodisca vitripennis]